MGAPSPGFQHGDVVGVAVDSRDRVFVLTRRDARCIIYEPDGTFVRSFGEDVFTERIHALTIDHHDFVYTVDDGDHTVRKFSPDGALLMTLGTPGVPSDTGYDGKVTSSITRLGPPFNRPTKAAIGPNGDIFVSDGYGNARIHRFSSAGELIESWGELGSGPGQFSVPHGIWVADDRVFVADRKTMVESLLEAVRGAGLKADGVDLDAFALVRTLVSGGDGADESARVFCHLAGVTNLAIAVGPACFFTRPLSAVWDEPDAGSRLSDEIRLSIDYYMTQPQAQPVGEVVCPDPGSGDEELVESLGVHLGLPLRVAWPLGGLDISASPPRRIPTATPLRRASRSERRHEARQSASAGPAAPRPRARAPAAPMWSSACSVRCCYGPRLRAGHQPGDLADQPRRRGRAKAHRARVTGRPQGRLHQLRPIKNQRLLSVGSIAATRFDWERFMRELARIMPEQQLDPDRGRLDDRGHDRSSGGAAPTPGSPAATAAAGLRPRRPPPTSWAARPGSRTRPR